VYKNETFTYNIDFLWPVRSQFFCSRGRVRSTTAIFSNNSEITDLQAQVNKWEGKEKERVRLNLEDSCKKQMK